MNECLKAVLGDNRVVSFERYNAHGAKVGGDPIHKRCRRFLDAKPPHQLKITPCTTDAQGYLGWPLAVHICKSACVLGAAEFLTALTPFRCSVEKPFNRLRKTGLAVTVGAVEQDKMAAQVNCFNGGTKTTKVAYCEINQPHHRPDAKRLPSFP